MGVACSRHAHYTLSSGYFDIIMAVSRWDNTDELSGFKLGDPYSALVIARSHGLFQEQVC